MRSILFIISGFLITGCAQFTSDQNASEWDFDHKVRFEQKQLTKNSYAITVLRNNDTHFAQLATFLIRHAHQLCQGQDYSIDTLEGVETVDDKKARSHRILPPLSAKIECVEK